MCRFRDLLVDAALRHGVVPLLLARLDWRASGHAASSSGQGASASDAGSASGSGGADASSAAGSGGDRDEAVARVLAVDVLHLLAAEGAHAAQVGVTADVTLGGQFTMAIQLEQQLLTTSSSVTKT